MEKKVSDRMHCYPRDFLKRFGSGGGEIVVEGNKGELSEVELSLGLSMGGCSAPKDGCFLRSPSIDSLSSLFSHGNVFPAAAAAAAAAAPLARTLSLPADAQEKKKRKELQSLKRSEAKRKRSEKSVPSSKEDPKGDILADDDLDASQIPSNRAVPSLLPTPPARRDRARVRDGSKCFTAPETQASFESQGSSYSGVYDLACRGKQGFNILGSNSSSEAKSASPAIAFFPQQKNRAPAIDPPPTTTSRAVSGTENESRRANLFAKEAERDMMKEMPCVSTRGGPNCRRIEGFLYKYRKGEEVRIVCVCHGRFFTPAEFVKHAGGGEVAHPLRHIVVNPAPTSIL
ncbi:ninja-family protein 2-like [Zingiber officinale]|uniref:ninja-family protein 2-like n=1 Tax=Zingiber officinale TaxID=94328 RepID=UPI001C4D8901|nr:ninja-family protein 2-like [Zingiber officinale]XP_042392773.1 ninja-family protein 2-like [Zingiber officinale]